MKISKQMKRIIAVLLVVILAIQTSCYYPKDKPGWEYMPDMANAISYETYSENPFYSDSMASRKPVTGTIPRGVYMPFHFSANPSGYDSAGAMLKFPVNLNAADSLEGARLFNIYCAVCHGTGGKGNGSIVENPVLKNPFPPPPSYFSDNLINLSEGKMYHSVHYGKNLMGAYSRGLNRNQVWQVVYFVKSMQQHYIDSAAVAAAPKTAITDSTKKN